MQEFHHLQAYSSIIQGVEDEKTIITLEGSDSSPMNRTLSFQLTSLPKHGTFQQSSGRPVSIRVPLDDKSIYPYTHGIKFEYIPNKDFFTEPRFVNQEENFEIFSFIVIAASQNGLVESSSPANVTIDILNVNDPPSISGRLRNRTIYTFSSLTWDKNECLVCQSKALFYEPIKVIDSDKNFDFVRVDILSSNGIISLTQDILNMSDFATCANRTGMENDSWNCKGSPTGDNELTFLARPHDIVNILANMTFESFIEGQDHVTITIYDGEGGECLSKQEHEAKHAIHGLIGRPSIHLGCTKISTDVQINVIKPKLKSNDSILQNLPAQFIIALGFACIVGSCVIFSYITKKKTKTGRKNESPRDRI